jgi:hypothetical protein
MRRRARFLNFTVNSLRKRGEKTNIRIAAIPIAKLAEDK